MRTTVTLDPDTAELVRRRMQEHGLTFERALNDLIRKGASPAPFETAPASLGECRVTVDRALQAAADFEDNELIRKKQAGS